MKRSRRWPILGLLTACALVASACGSSGSGANSGGSSAATSGGEIVVGSIASCSGAQAGSEGGVCKAIQAWASSVNDSGGINGHRVRLIVKDDGGNPTTSLDLVKQLVEQDHVIAIVNDESNVDATWASYIQSKGIPVVGGLMANAPFLTNPDFFPSGTSQIAFVYGALASAKAAGKTNYGFMYCAEAPQCAQAVPLIQALGAVAGIRIGYTAKVAGAAPDYTAPCLAAKAAGVDALQVGSSATIVLRVLDSCAQQGFKPLTSGVDGTVTTAWLNDPNVDGAVAVEVDAPFFDQSIPATKAFHDAMKKYAPDVYNGPLFGANVSYAWVSGKLFEAAAKKADIGPNSTPAQVKQGLYQLKDETLDGLAPPLTFIEGKPTFVNCYFTVGIQNGKFTTPDGLRTQCAPMDKLEPVLKGLGG